MMNRQHLPPSAYSVAWVSALPIEWAAAQEMLDEEHPDPRNHGNNASQYVFGRMGSHNVVMACLPSGKMGNNLAAAVAGQLITAFPSITFAFMVGIGGGVPSDSVDIRLGDVVVGHPHRQYGGVVQYDFGKTGPNGQILRTGPINSPPRELLDAIAQLRANHYRGLNNVSKHLFISDQQAQFSRPTAGPDVLFQARYEHNGGDSCERCNKQMSIDRPERASKEVMIHYGTIASGNQVIKDGMTRDRISAELDRVLCFEMEAAGLVSTFPSVVIRGICDYADSHKNKSWQPYAAVTAAAVAKEILSLVPVVEPPENRSPEVIPLDHAGPEEDFSITFSLAETSETTNFVARQNELDQLYKMLHKGLGDGRRTVVLHGLGGIGKTQLAIAYAKRHKRDYSAVFWLNIKDEDSIKSSFARAAKQIWRDHPSASRLSAVTKDSNLDKVVDAVKSWLDHPKNTRWLLIFDNYDNPKLSHNTHPAAVDIRSFLPDAYHGSVIITTRSSKVKIGRQIHVTKLLDVNDNLQILVDASRRDDARNDPAAAKLIEKLDGLPLALATAGAYLDQVAMSFADYLDLYDKSWARLQETSPQLDSYQNRALYSTWQVSFNHIKLQNQLSAQLLKFWAYFDNQDLWFELIQRGGSDEPEWHGPEWLTQLTRDKLSFTEAARLLCDYGLVEADNSVMELDSESNGYSMHSCVHSWTTHVLNKEGMEERGLLALRCIAQHVPDQNYRNPWTLERRLIRHVARSWSFVGHDVKIQNDLSRVCHSFAKLCTNQGKLEEAEEMYQYSLKGCEKDWGRDHTSTLRTVNNLGRLYFRWGKLVDAEEMYQRALKGCEKAWGPDHTLTLDAVNNLGLLYADQGKLVEAEEMYQRVLRGYEKARGPDHTSTLDTIHNLGLLYISQGELVDAEEMYQRALTGYEKALGPDHTATLDTVNNLGLLYADQGKLSEAEEMYHRALEGYEKAWGPDHKSTLRTINNLGILYVNQGELVEAEKMYQRALKGHEKVLGLNHTSTLDTVNNLGLLYADQGKLAEAEKMYQRALEGYEKAWGPDHISTLRTVNNLGILYVELGKPSEAEEMYRRALKGKEKALGPDHTSTLNTVDSLGMLYILQNKLKEAENMLSRAFKGQEKVWGHNHHLTLNPALGLSLLHAEQGRQSDAESLFRRCFKNDDKTAGIQNKISYVLSQGVMKFLVQYLAARYRLPDRDSIFMQIFRECQDSLGHEHSLCRTVQERLRILKKRTDSVSVEGSENPTPT